MGLLSQLFNPATGLGSNGQAPGAPVMQTQIQPSQPFNTPAPTPAPTEAPKPGSALDQFTKLWETPTNKDGQPIVHQDPLAAPALTFDPAKIAESAGKINFAAAIPQEILQKAVGNGGDANALIDVINQAVRTAVVGVTTSQGKLLNDVITQNNQRVQQALPTAVKRAQLEAPVDDPIMDHPAVAPLIRALTVAEFNKDPNANPAEVRKTVTDYVRGLGTAISTSTAQQTQSQTTKQEMDWDSWVGQ